MDHRHEVEVSHGRFGAADWGAVRRAAWDRIVLLAAL